MQALSRRRSGCRNARAYQLRQILHDIPALVKLQSGCRKVFIGLPIEADAIGPCEPRLPDARDDPTQRPLRPHIFQKPNKPARLDDSAKFPQSRQLQPVGQNAEEEGCYRSVEGAIREFEIGDIHTVEPSRRRHGGASAMRTRQHRRARVNTGDNRIGRVKGAISASTDS